MKHRAIIIAVAAFAFASCDQPVAVPETPAAPAPEPAAAQTPAPVAVAPVATPATPVPELAPPGVFYLITTVRVEHDSGVTGLPPGTGVKLLREGIYQSPAGEIALGPDQITNNLGLARQARDADRARQTSAQLSGAAQVEAAQAAAAVKAAENAVQHQQALAGIDRKRLETHRTALIAEQQRLEAQLKELRAKHSRETYNRIAKGRTVIATTTAEIAEVEAALKTLRQQIQALR